MTRVQWLLMVVVTAELASGGYVLSRRLGRATPPVPDLAAVDPVAAEDLRVLAANCSTPAQWARLGEVYLATGFFPESAACFRTASALDWASADFAFKHAFALERIGMLDEANAQYEAAILRNHPRAAHCRYYMARNHLRLEQADRAMNEFKEAGALAGARYELAVLNARAGRIAEADAEATRLSAEFPETYEPVSLRYRLAVARQKQLAADRFADLFVNRPRPLPTPFDTEVAWVFGVANGVGRDRLFRDAGREMQAGRAGSAEANLRRALAAGWSPEMTDKLADVLFALGRPQEAAAVLAEAVARGGPSFGLLWRLGQAYDALGQPQRAVELWERAAQSATGPGAKGLWQDLAERYQRTGNPVRAKPFQAKALLSDAMDELSAGKAPAAIAALKQAVKADPNFAHAWYYWGEAYRADDRPSDSRPAYERCLQIDPDHGRALRALKLLDR